MICQSDLAKPWDPHITVSDTCLSGTAVCSLQSGNDTVSKIGSQRELWRYKSNASSVKAREVVRKLDPFKDVETVLDKHVFEDPF